MARQPPSGTPQNLISGLFSDGGWGIIQTLWPCKGWGKTDCPRGRAVNNRSSRRVWDSVT